MPGFSGQGIVYIAPRLSSGLPGVFRDFGNASVFEAGLSQDNVERNESRTGFRLPNRRLTKSQGGTIKIVGDEFNKDNLALATLGTKSSVAAGGAPITGYVLPNPLAVGDKFIIPTKNATGVAIKDSTGSPKTLTLDTNYSFDAASGMGTILNLTTGGAYTQPLKADYTSGAFDVVGAMKNASAEYFIRLDGVNTDDSNRRVICDVFRVRLNPAKVLALISNDYLDFELDGSMLADLTRQASDPEGQFFSVTPL